LFDRVKCEEGGDEMNFVWGLLGPETLSSARRTRTLGLASVVRYFNDRAVPGLGGVWYGKQVMLALLGVVVAERAKQQNPKFNASNIQVANAIEALACWSAFKNNSASDPRLRGREKLSGKQAKDFVFTSARKPGFYLTQPMRMQTVQPLPALGFVTATGERFNSFTPTQEGLKFVEAACEGYRPYNRDVVSHLMKWVLGQDNGVNTDELSNALSPLEAMPDEARRLLRERLKQGNTERHNALAWIEALKGGQAKTASGELQRPTQIGETHWRDIQAGALFLPLHDLAVATLDAVEDGMGQDCSLENGAEKAKAQLQALKDASQKFLDFKYTGRQDALDFCGQCVAEPVNALCALVQRDETVLRWDGEKIRRGPAFQGNAVREADPTQEPAGDTPVPPGLSYRFRNLYRLNLDLNDELGAWLNPDNNEGAA
jgi:hypothetical protein